MGRSSSKNINPPKYEDPICIGNKTYTQYAYGWKQNTAKFNIWMRLTDKIQQQDCYNIQNISYCWCIINHEPILLPNNFTIVKDDTDSYYLYMIHNEQLDNNDEKGIFAFLRTIPDCNLIKINLKYKLYDKKNNYSIPNMHALIHQPKHKKKRNKSYAKSIDTYTNQNNIYTYTNQNKITNIYTKQTRMIA